MKKLKIYLDTSIISHLQADDVKEKMEITQDLWNKLKTRKFKACISEMVTQELNKCYESKRQYLFEMIADIDFEFYRVTEEVQELAQSYIEAGAFTEKHLEDALHVACATVNNCNAVVS